MPPARPLEARFWEKVDKNGPTMPHMNTNCWVWTAFCNEYGYGMVRNGKKMELANRTGFELQHRPLKPKEQSLHHCDNPPCIRGDHLFGGTHADNMRDRREKGRDPFSQQTHCVNDHPFDREDKYQRYCTTCKREVAARQRAKKPAEEAP